MLHRDYFAGVYAAAVTPLKTDYSLDLEALPEYLAFLAERGCHGALLLGTTGEGPSFSPEERVALFRAALPVRQEYPSFRLLAGVGTPSLGETVYLTRSAFDLGFDGVVSLPPFYFRDATDEGLFAWFSEVIRSSVPQDRAFFAYHFPKVSGVALSLELLARLKEAFPNRFAGLKNSSADPSYTQKLGEQFGEELIVYGGNPPLFSFALAHHAAGSITSLANLASPQVREVWDARLGITGGEAAQARLSELTTLLNRFPPAAAVIKSVLAALYQLPEWTVRPPLLPLTQEVIGEAVEAFRTTVPETVSGEDADTKATL